MISPQSYNNYLGSAKKSPIKMQKKITFFKEAFKLERLRVYPRFPWIHPQLSGVQFSLLGESRFYFTRIFLPLWM